MGNKIVSVVQLQELCAGIFGFGKACLVSLMATGAVGYVFQELTGTSGQGMCVQPLHPWGQI